MTHVPYYTAWVLQKRHVSPGLFHNACYQQQKAELFFWDQQQHPRLGHPGVQRSLQEDNRREHHLQEVPGISLLIRALGGNRASVFLQVSISTSPRLTTSAVLPGNSPPASQEHKSRAVHWQRRGGTWAHWAHTWGKAQLAQGPELLRHTTRLGEFSPYSLSYSFPRCKSTRPSEVDGTRWELLPYGPCPAKGETWGAKHAERLRRRMQKETMIIEKNQAAKSK